MADQQSLTFRTSRAKALPLAIVTPVFVSIPAIPTCMLLTSLISTGNADHWGFGLGFAVVSILFLFAEYVLIRRVIWPDTLELSKDGFSLTRFGRSKAFRWSDYREATKKYVSSGKSGSFYARLEPRGEGKPVLIPAETYVQPLDVVIDAVQKAQAGKLIELPPEKTPRVYAYFAVPVSIGAAVLFFGTVFYFVWEINGFGR
jgi:hypothetical protein